MRQKSRLTNYQQRVAYLVANGLTSNQAASIIGCTEKTVKFHLTAIYKELNVTRKEMIGELRHFSLYPWKQKEIDDIRQPLTIGELPHAPHNRTDSGTIADYQS